LAAYIQELASYELVVNGGTFTTGLPTMTSASVYIEERRIEFCQ